MRILDVEIVEFETETAEFLEVKLKWKGADTFISLDSS